MIISVLRGMTFMIIPSSVFSLSCDGTSVCSFGKLFLFFPVKSSARDSWLLYDYHLISLCPDRPYAHTVTRLSKMAYGQ